LWPSIPNSSNFVAIGRGPYTSTQDINRASFSHPEGDRLISTT
jgi:hypothetical protein